jgi:glycosyltransferase involved in cell wall biosynthesis
VTTERPRVSTVIAVRDGEAFLAEAIESALGQTEPPAELIVVEDSSTDRSAEIARSYAPDVLLIQPEPRGLGGARNAGVEASSGELLAFLDSDDLWEPRKLELQLAAFERHPALDFVFSRAQEFASERDAERFEVRPGAQPGGLASSLLARREAIERAGGFDIDVRLADVLTWLSRARNLGMRETTLPDVLVRRRVHANNLTRVHRNNMSEYARVLKESLDRRRESA